MGTTAAYGLRYPEPTDKVADGALAIRNLAEDVDADLGAEVTRANAAYVAQALADAKGDLIAASGPDAFGRLAPGADGQVLTADAAAALGVKWAATSGGLSGTTSATIATLESTTSTGYVDLATVGPSVTPTIGASGRALVIVTAGQQNNTADQDCLMSFAATGVTPGAALALRFRSNPANQLMQGSAVFVVTGLAAGALTFTAKYSVTGGTGNFLNRSLTVIPL